jgi:hypothetical protein
MVAMLDVRATCTAGRGQLRRPAFAEPPHAGGLRLRAGRVRVGNIAEGRLHIDGRLVPTW